MPYLVRVKSVLNELDLYFNCSIKDDPRKIAVKAASEIYPDEIWVFVSVKPEKTRIDGFPGLNDAHFLECHPCVEVSRVKKE